MIDPVNITKYGASRHDLEEVILFWICVAGKTAKQIAPRLNTLLRKWQPVAKGKRGLLPGTRQNPSPFEIVRVIENLPQELKDHGIGCFNAKARSIQCLVAAGLNLKKCSVEDLEKIPGIGPKTARCFLMHSRENAPYAGLDTHVLKFLKEMGYKVPKSTPTGKRYRELEKNFIYLAGVSGYTTSEFDLMIWNAYSGNKGTPEDILNMMQLKSA